MPTKFNMSSAIEAARRIVKQLHRKGQQDLKEYIDQVNKAVKQGTLVQLSDLEVTQLHTRPHCFTHHGIVYKPDSLSTSVRLINNTIETLDNLLYHVLPHHVLFLL